MEAADCELSYVIDMRYYRQGFELPIDVSAGELDALDLDELADRFRYQSNSPLAGNNLSRWLNSRSRRSSYGPTAALRISGTVALFIMSRQ